MSQSGGFIGKGRQGAIRRAKINAEGGVKGESDLAILLSKGRFGSFLLEHKAAGAKHIVSEAQQEYLDHHNAAGNCAVSTRGVGAAKAAIKAYMEMDESTPDSKTEGSAHAEQPLQEP